MTVFHDLSSGCALLPEIGPMYGPDAVSETELARNGMAKLPGGSVVMTDAGFGIFGVAYEAARYGHGFLLRMKKTNFLSLAKKATLVTQSDNSKTYSLNWKPTAGNCKTQPGLPEDASVDVILHEVRVNDKLTLYLVTSLEHDATTLAELFQFRVEVEFDIRNFKVVMDAENSRAKSVEMFKKELYTSMVAYNLVGQFRRQAAEIIEVAPRKMSFKRTWTTFQHSCCGTCIPSRDDGGKRSKKLCTTRPKTSYQIAPEEPPNAKLTEKDQRMYSSKKDRNRHPK